MIIVDHLRLKKSVASCYKYSAVVRLYASESTAGTMDAAPLDVEDNIDGNQWYTSIQKLQETSLQALAAVRRFPGEKLVVRARQHPPALLPMVDVAEARPKHGGPADGTRVPQIRVRSVEWDVSSTAVLTCYYVVLLRCRR